MPQYHIYFSISFLIIIAIIGIGATIVGFWGMKKRRPLFFNYQEWSWAIYLFIFIFFSLMLASYATQFFEIETKELSFGNMIIIILLSALPAFLLGVLPRLWRGKFESRILICGINHKVLNVLGQALEKERIAYKEIHERFKLTDSNTMIYITVRDLVGFTELKIEPKMERAILNKIIQSMKAYDKDHTDHFSMRFMILLVIAGLASAGVGLFLAYSYMTLV